MIIWICLIALIIGLLCFDLLILHGKNAVVSNKKAARETAFWITVALGFSGVLYWLYGTDLVENPTNLSQSQAVLKYITGYLVELSLSVDNLFVIAVIFKSYQVPLKYQHRTLFWGIIGAIVFRGIMIIIGVTLFNKVSWITYVFGAFLIFTALKMFWEEKKGEEEKPAKKNIFRKFLRRFIVFSNQFDGQKFFTRKQGILMATPLFSALLAIEFTDLLFALDSIPAIIAITSDSLLVFCATIFATLGLRSMYFFLANMLEKFHYLKYSVMVILVFVGVKLILMHDYEFPEWLSLGVIIVSLALGIIVSLLTDKKKAHD